MATLDPVSFLRINDGYDPENPSTTVKTITARGIFQFGRFLHDLMLRGFNVDESGAKVFDGAMPHKAGSGKTFTHDRFAQAGRYSRQHEDHDFSDVQFPFTYTETNDPDSGQSGRILSRDIHTNILTKFRHGCTKMEDRLTAAIHPLRMERWCSRSI